MIILFQLLPTFPVAVLIDTSQPLLEKGHVHPSIIWSLVRVYKPGAAKRTTEDTVPSVVQRQVSEKKKVTDTFMSLSRTIEVSHNTSR